MALKPLYNADIHQKHLNACTLHQLHGEKQLYERLIETGEEMHEGSAVEIFRMRLRMTKLAILERTLTGEPDGQ
jgi:hypothetical protein